MPKEIEMAQRPKTWSDRYSDEDKALVRSIVDWLNDPRNRDNGWNRTMLARAAVVPSSTFHLVINGTYSASPTKHLKKAIEVIQREAERNEQGVHLNRFVETSVWSVVLAACKRAHVYRGFAVVSAYVGTGKTTAVKRYVETHPSAVLLEATPNMTAAIMLTELAELTGAIVHKASKWTDGTQADKMRAIINTLKGTDRLLILDEAETVTPQCLEVIRRVSDKAEVGVVLSGTQRLKPLVKDPLGRFGQVSSRTIFWPAVIQSITPDDAAALTRSALAGDDVELTDEILDAFWQMCDGSARVLCKGLIPGVRDYALKQGVTLTPDVIFKVAQQILGFTVSKKRKRA